MSELLVGKRCVGAGHAQIIEPRHRVGIPADVVGTRSDEGDVLLGACRASTRKPTMNMLGVGGLEVLCTVNAIHHVHFSPMIDYFINAPRVKFLRRAHLTERFRDCLSDNHLSHSRCVGRPTIQLEGLCEGSCRAIGGPDGAHGETHVQLAVILNWDDDLDHGDLEGSILHLILVQDFRAGDLMKL